MIEQPAIDLPTGTNKLAQCKRLFLTGGSGYVGRNLIRHFRKLGVQVVALARSSQSAELVKSLGAEPYLGDILSSSIEDGMAGCDALVHAVADTNHGLGSTRQREINVVGTRNVFEAARKAGIVKAIHISSESVLADGKPLINIDETRPIPRKSAGSYSSSKAAAEWVALGFNSASLAVVVLRPRFSWSRDDTTALPSLIAAARSRHLAWISGGTYLTSTTHIANLCSAVELAIRHGQSGEVYFISDGAPVEFRQFVTQLLETQDLSAPEKSVPRPLLHVIAKLGDLIGAVSRGRIKFPLTLQAFATSAVEVTLNICKAQRELGYVSVISRAQGLDEMRSRTWAARKE